MNIRLIEVRVLAFRAIIAITFIILSFQLWRLQVAESEQYRLRADDNRLSVIAIDAPRGIIYDRRGTILVRNKPSYTVNLIPANTPENEVEREAMFAQLASLLNIPVTVDPQLRARLDEAGLQPLVFPPPPQITTRGIRQMYEEGLIVPYNRIVLKENVDRDTAALIQEWLVRLPGVELKVEPMRSYLTGPLTAHILGYVGRIPQERAEQYKAEGYGPNDRVGLTGVEYAYEQELRGRKGRKLVEVDVTGRTVRAIGPAEEAVPGYNLVLTVDLELQRVMEAALRKGMEQARSTAGVAIAMDPRTGEILGMVSLPAYDNNLFAARISLEDYLRLNIDRDRPLVNHAIGGLYPPGSIFKLIPAVAALQEGVVDPRQQFLCKGIMWVPNRYFPDDPEMAQPFHCWAEEGHGLVNLITGLAVSCDIYFYHLGGGYGQFEGLGLDTLVHYMELFGLGEPTGIDLPGETTSIVPSAQWKRLTYAESWVTGDTYNMSIGQGFVMATPLQMLNATAAVANWGTLFQPQVVREILGPDGQVVKAFRSKVIRELPVSMEALALVREGMRAAVEWGTATGAQLPNIVVAGKTGTAEFPGPRNAKGRLPTHAWFTAFAPYDNPEIALIVFIKGGGEGSLTAVPVAQEILSYYFTTPHETVGGDSLLVPPTPAVITTTQQTGSQPDTPSTPDIAAAPPTPVTAGGFRGRLVRVEPSGHEISTLIGRVVDAEGNGLPGIQVTINGGGEPIFEPTTGPNGEFRYDLLNPYSSPRWNVRVLDAAGSEEVRLDVEPFKVYTVQFERQ